MPRTVEQITREELIRRYCQTQDATPDAIGARLDELIARYAPTGFLLAECQMLDSSRMGEQIILPYGPSNTFKEPPDRPFSPRGLASDMSVVTAVWPIGGAQ